MSYQLGTVQHRLSVVKIVWSFTDCILRMLNVNDEDKLWPVIYQSQ